MEDTLGSEVETVAGQKGSQEGGSGGIVKDVLGTTVETVSEGILKIDFRRTINKC